MSFVGLVAPLTSRARAAQQLRAEGGDNHLVCLSLQHSSGQRGGQPFSVPFSAAQQRAGGPAVQCADHCACLDGLGTIPCEDPLDPALCWRALRAHPCSSNI